MKRNMKQWIEALKNEPKKKPLPVLSFPGIQLMGITVRELISSSELQARCMKAVADRVDSAASVSFMDLSVEAECFGSTIRVSDDEVPTVIGSIVKDEDDADALQVPEVGSGRTQIYVDAIGKAVELIQDRPVLAGVIGPFSLAGRLLDVSEAMIYCYDDPDMVHVVLEKVSRFITKYILAFKAAGANGVVMAEPLAGLLSPALAEEFSAEYVKKIIDQVQDDEFIVVYHNCGNCTIQQIDSILETGSPILHFGNAIDIKEMMTHIPPHIIGAGNVDPAGEFKNGTVESITAATKKVLEDCREYKNFVISSGCDIPPMSRWENIDAFFETVKNFEA
ncbi:MAG TPA: uroporphyrinogen decarboxylase family protein [Candidatus Scybalocola faecigallinarum]|uniref:Uroporphyrinogen decarboxylase family protein n=1 Tax=Candidatus Scybalocola faecigallinarum TaxID=2840941 RepID=A0A9D1JQL6_9FIRM|nr:uroporphyrinogen decarboxylase family protein [Candidatus Scybalocola faecigallinarum]